jgi:hypothetical protein
LPVFECKSNKRPDTRNGHLDATNDVEIVGCGWWGSDQLIGVATGCASGIAVLDIDPRHGGDVWYRDNAHRLDTRMHETRSGGWHLLFKHREGLCNSTALIAPGVDVRAQGGYAIWWPAHGFSIANYRPLSQLPDWPSWLVIPNTRDRVRADAHKRWRSGRVLADRHHIDGLVNFVRRSREGERNTCLFWAACRLGELVFLKGEAGDAAAERLIRAGMSTGLDYAEALRAVTSGLRRGGSA